MANPILPPSARRIAEESGGTLLEEYENYGLTCYRSERELPSGNIIVEEGWIETKVLPNGKVIHITRKHKDVTRETAENER